MATLLVTGANRGLGLEMVRQYSTEGWQAIACCRNPESARELAELASSRDVTVVPLDVADLKGIEQLADDLDGRSIDVLVNNAGLFGPKAQADQDLRQSFGQMDYSVWQSVLQVNLMAPFKMAECFLDSLAAGDQKKVVNISSGFGSIHDTGPGIYAYRTSKAALNMAMATMARELEARGIAVGIFCPGWVRTDMGGADAPLSPEQSITGLRHRIAELTLENSGRFTRFDGTPIPW